jgi:hypothetical protein
MKLNVLNETMEILELTPDDNEWALTAQLHPCYFTAVWRVWKELLFGVRRVG